MLLNTEGKVYAWGWNNYGQCGAYPDSTKQNLIIPMFKKESNKSQKLPLINYKTSDDILPIQNIQDILINDNYSMVLTEKGNVISFGKNSNGELGLGHRKQVKNAQLISKFKNKVKIIKTTGNLNLLLSKNNELFIWSNSKKIQIQKPTMIYLPNRINILSISTGKKFRNFIIK
jgi:alpha-tubulin suppressor-like RCC1 family protein